MKIPQLNPIKIFKRELVKELKIQNQKIDLNNGKGVTSSFLVKAFKGLGIHLSVVLAMEAL